jgi:hypothetical protein
MIGLCASSLGRAIELNRLSQEMIEEYLGPEYWDVLAEACACALQYADGALLDREDVAVHIKRTEALLHTFTLDGVVELLYALDAAIVAEEAEEENLERRQTAMNVASTVVPAGELATIAADWCIRSLSEDRPLDEVVRNAARAAWVIREWQAAAEIVRASPWIRHELERELKGKKGS